jgi:hypothetical protein
MLLVHDDLNEYQKLGRERIGDLIDRMTAWSESLRKAGIHRGAEKLTDDPGRVLRRKGGMSVTDGPYAESRELIGGYFLIEAQDYDAATRIARECPAYHVGSEIEIREVASSCEVVLERARD